ncbi:MAG: methyltransferase domain-containing protein [Thermodesulfobacteriota bacterium]
MRKKTQPRGILERIRFLKSHPVWKSQYSAFVKAVSQLRLPAASTGLSVSCGDGTWDFLALTNNHNLKKIIATDVVDCPVSGDDINLLNAQAAWSFQRVSPDTVLPVSDSLCELVLHQDVIEHTPKPYLLLRENHRVLKPGGYLLCGTPNIFRPANILKLMSGRLSFPWRLTTGLLNPAYLNPGVQSDDMVHVQEFNQYQLRTMLEEVGFEVVSLARCFFGVSFLKLNFCDFPTGNLGGNLCQYLFCVARKRS